MKLVLYWTQQDVEGGPEETHSMVVEADDAAGPIAMSAKRRTSSIDAARTALHFTLEIRQGMQVLVEDPEGGMENVKADPEPTDERDSSNLPGRFPDW